MTLSADQMELKQIEQSATPELEAFIGHLRLERALSQHTCDNYQRDITKFCHFLANRNIDVLTVNLSHGQEFIIELKNSGLKNSSIARHISALRSFYSYLILASITSHNPIELLRAPRQVRPLPHSLSVEDVARLIEAPDVSEPGGIRDRAM